MEEGRAGSSPPADVELELIRPALAPRRNPTGNFWQRNQSKIILGILIYGSINGLTVGIGSLATGVTGSGGILAGIALATGSISSGAAAWYYRRNFTENGRAAAQENRSAPVMLENRSDEDIARARFGFEPVIVPQLFTYQPSSFTLYPTESLIESLKKDVTTDQLIAATNHLFINNATPTSQSINASLKDPEEFQSAQNMVRESFQQGFNYSQGAARPITDPTLLQVLSHAYLVGFLKKARSDQSLHDSSPDGIEIPEDHSSHDLPNVDLDVLTQKYENFYQRFSQHCQTKYGADDGLRCANYFHQMFTPFVSNGAEFSFGGNVEPLQQPAIAEEMAQTADISHESKTDSPLSITTPSTANKLRGTEKVKPQLPAATTYR